MSVMSGAAYTEGGPIDRTVIGNGVVRFSSRRLGGAPAGRAMCGSATSFRVGRPIGSG